MGAKASKPVVEVVKRATPEYSLEKNLGRDIVDKIKLKTSDVNEKDSFQKLQSTGLYKRQQMDKMTEGTVSWSDVPKLFSEPANSEARKRVQKHFKLISK